MSKILLVEDNKLSQKMMYYTLKHEGIISDLAENGQQAVDMANSNDYDLILMDIRMPILDGYEAARLIRQHEQSSGHRSVIFGLTSNIYDSERSKCIEAGMDDYLPKPFDIDQFRNLSVNFHINL